MSEPEGRSAPASSQIVTIAKEPVAGKVKTRLTPPFTPQQAASLAEAALADTLHAVCSARACRRVLALAGRPGLWLPPGFDVIGQRGAGLDERLACAFADTWDGLAAPIVLIGMDTPQVTGAILDEAIAPLAEGGADAVFGPAADGGFWLLGLRRPDPDLLLGVPMSTALTGAAQLARLEQAGLRVAMLPVLTDVDTVIDAKTVAAQCPDTRFAGRLRGLLAADFTSREQLATFSG